MEGEATLADLPLNKEWVDEALMYAQAAEDGAVLHNRPQDAWRKGIEAAIEHYLSYFPAPPSSKDKGSADNG